MSEHALPDPPVPPDCDCTDLDGFMLNVERLMASELVALGTHEEIAAAMFLWCRAWKQVPAASLPDDERVIAAFCRLPIARFKKVRGTVLRGFVKCSDGRLYHRFLAKEALQAFERKNTFRKKREADAERLRKWRASQTETPTETNDETRFVAEGQGQGQGLKEERKKEAAAQLEREPEKAPNPSRPKSRYPDLEARLREAAGWQNDPNPNLFVTGPIAELLDRGADLERDVLDVIRARASRMKRSPGGGWRYFVEAVVEAMERRIAIGSSAPASPPETAKLWEARLYLARRDGRWWTQWGPLPHAPGCRAPPDMLRPGDGGGWAISEETEAA